MKYKKGKIKEETWVWDNLKSTNNMQLESLKGSERGIKRKKYLKGEKGLHFFPNVISL